VELSGHGLVMLVRVIGIISRATVDVGDVRIGVVTMLIKHCNLSVLKLLNPVG